METLFSFLAACGFALVHLFAGKLRFLDGIPRSRWLSAAGGASVAYVFLHLLPELGEGHEVLGEVLGFVEQRAYAVALLGLAVFYGLERAALSSRRDDPDDPDDGDAFESTEPGVFWLHVGSFGVYNLIVGYLLLHRETPEPISLLWYFVAMGLHFFVNDYGLREHHKRRYHDTGRWLLAVAVLVGWGLGLVIEINEAFVTALFAFLAGGVVLNVLKEELPEKRNSRFSSFALGMAAYAALLLLT